MAASTDRPNRCLLLVAVVTAAATLALAACGSGVDDLDAAPTTTQAPVTATTGGGAAATTTTTAAGATTTVAAAPTTTAAPAAIPDPRPPGDLGDDPELDALADECFEGDFSSCDQLFYNSTDGSAYEAYGDSCGGRNQPEGLCVRLYGQG